MLPTPVANARHEFAMKSCLARAMVEAVMAMPRARAVVAFASRLDSLDVFRLGSLGTLLGLKFDFVSFG